MALENKKIKKAYPEGLLTTTVIFFLCWFLENNLDYRNYTINQPWKNIILFLLVLEASIIFFWAFTSGPQRSKTQLSIGVYSFMRNPVYFTIIFHATLFSYVLMGSLLFLSVVPLQYAVWLRLIRREEQSLVGIYGQEYLDYMLAVPRFFPWRRL